MQFYQIPAFFFPITAFFGIMCIKEALTLPSTWLVVILNIRLTIVGTRQHILLQFLVTCSAVKCVSIFKHTDYNFVFLSEIMRTIHICTDKMNTELANTQFSKLPLGISTKINTHHPTTKKISVLVRTKL